MQMHKPNLTRADKKSSDSSLSLRRQLTYAYHILDLHGQGSDLSGHITARMPDAQSFWTHPADMAFGEVTLDDLQEADFDLNVVRGNRRIKRALDFHAAIYRARPDVGCVVHTHPVHCIALGVLGRNLELVTQESCKFADSVALHEEYGGPPNSENSEAIGIVRALGDLSALLLKNHGIIVVGNTVREAVLAALDLELTARTQLTAMAVGAPGTVPRDAALAAKALLLSDALLEARWNIYQREAQRKRSQLLGKAA